MSRMIVSYSHVFGVYDIVTFRTGKTFPPALLPQSS